MESIMVANVNDMDRTLRILAGLAILFLFFVLDGAVRWWGLVGFVLLVTGALRWCPAYLPFGISTCKKAPAHDCCGQSAR
jgi:Ca2+/Na+ antiporter